MSAGAEWLVRSIKTQCLDQMILLGPASVERAISEYTPTLTGSEARASATRWSTAQIHDPTARSM